MWTHAFGFLKTPLGRRLVFGVGLACAVGSVFYLVRSGGYAACERDHQAKLAESIQRAGEAAREIALQDAEIALATERNITQWRTRTVEIIRRVDSAIPPDCARCAVAPRLRDDINSLLRGETPDTGDAERTLPDAPSTRDGHLPGSNGRACCDSRSVKRVSGEAQGLGESSWVAGGV